MQDRLDDLDGPVADEQVLGRHSHRPAQLAGDHPVLRRIELQQPAQLARADDLAVEVVEEEVGGVGVGQEAGVDPEPQLGDQLGQRRGTRRVRAGFPLQELDPLGQAPTRAG